MRIPLLILLGVILASLLAFTLFAPITATASKTLLRRCEKNYNDDELAAMQADGEDGYEPDDCPLLAHVLTGPMYFNFCQAGDEDWIKFQARANMLYQIRAAPDGNYPTEPHLDLYDQDAATILAQNDHYFANNAEIWWWNSGGDRWVYLRATELRGRHDCGNSAYTVSLHAFEQNPYPPAVTPTLVPTATLTATETLTPTNIFSRTATLTATFALTMAPAISVTATITP